jgi:formylglycine-generating enzyme required for sulfatase activity/V8-like Glu-specific endopeptidase
MFHNSCVWLGLVALASAIASPAIGQSASYPGGTIYDLAPPMQQASGSPYLEALVLSTRQHRMKEIRDYAEGDVYRTLARPIGRLSMTLQVPGKQQRLGYCTGSLIAADLVLTNYHCIAGNPEGKVVDALLMLGLLDTRFGQGVERFGLELAPVEANASLDYAIHRVRGEPGLTWGTIRFDTGAKLLDRQSLFIIHHPAGDKQHITLGDCQTGAPAVENDDLLHVCDTIGGSSGAPVFANDSRRVVGLHYRAVEVGKLNAAKRIVRVVEMSPTLAKLAAAGDPEATARRKEVDELKALRAENERLKREREEAERQRVAALEKPTPPAPQPAPRPVSPPPQAPAAAIGGPKIGETFRDCAECPEMVVVAAGSFTMGSNDYDSEKPPRRVTIAQPFAVGKFEVTVSEYLACVAAKVCRAPEWQEAGSKYNVKTGTDDHYKKLGAALTAKDHPVVGVSWDDAKAFAKWMSTKTGQSYRLLTEAEWEYAARAGTTTKYPWGDVVGRGNANCDGCGSQWDNKQTAPVGSFKPNPFGLHDMHGNVWEWVEDCWIDSYKGAPSDASARTTACTESSQRVLRGGSWIIVPRFLRSAYRSRNSTGNRNIDYGFRVARPVVSPRPL